jgi:hypothetical protein
LWQGWQDICASAGLPPATWTVDLAQAITKAVHTYPAFDVWQQALWKMAAEPYFRSRKADGWENTLHWLVKGDHVHQVVSGYFTRRHAV